MTPRTAAVLCLLGLLSGCDGEPASREIVDLATQSREEAPAPARPAQAEAPVPDPPGAAAPPPAPVNLQTGPMALYEAACARCHGPEGAFFQRNFKHLDPAELREVVEEMMFGQGMLRPEPADVAAMTAYMGAVQRAAPFAVILNGAAAAAGEAERWRGEASPGARIRMGERETTAAEGLWTLESPPAPPATVEVLRDGRRATLRFPETQWSTPE